MSSRSLPSSTHPCIHSGCGAVPFSSHSPSPSLTRPHSLSPSGSQSTSHATILLSCLSLANEESQYPRIHVQLREGVLARPPSTCLHNIHRHRFGLPFLSWTDIHRRPRFMYQSTFNILAYLYSLSTVVSLDAFVLSTAVVAGALSYPECFCVAKGC
ncbi:hypothetical protein DFH08DRAFT_979635 [Mycena albidolilacea]|uniref:Uncharacterized protein n=1 Tax=Mycena albidolilacea TaxID=1033008 RepID=A0AAD7E699_9AGAR|nr:hypothetical protein DFH08DRAFT_979635 [Mycena albidolilacea]